MNSSANAISATQRKRARRSKAMDRIAGWIIRLGGGLVVLAVLGIFFFLALQILPLFRSAKADRWQQGAWTALPGRSPALAGIDEYEALAYALDPASGDLTFVSISDWTVATNISIPQLQGHSITAAYRTPSRDHLYIGTSDGKVIAVTVKFRVNYTNGPRSVVPYISDGRLIELAENGSAVSAIHGRFDDQNNTDHIVAMLADGRLLAISSEVDEKAKVQIVGGELTGHVTHVATDERGRKIFAATDSGKLYQWYLEDSAEKPYARLTPASPERPLTSMDFSIGGNALLIGFSDGSIEEWFGVRDQPDETLRPFKKIRSFEPLPAAVTQLQPSGRDKGFLAASRDGTLRLYFATSGRSLVTIAAGGEIGAICYSPKLASFMATTRDGKAALWRLSNPHPEISLATLFGKVWYEGHDAPAYDWQSTGGSDDFESKFGLVPLIVGTLKGAFYGLLFAVPVSVLAALYTSQFTPPKIRSFVKPLVEIMAALPSVVIGFLAGLWLAPVLDNHMVSVAAMVILIPALVLMAALIWNALPPTVRRRLPAGAEFAAIIPIVIAGFWVAIETGPILEQWLFHGSFKQWVFNETGQQFEQRNSIVIGIAMGFAVIPIIFTISEDALSNVPRHFVSGSLALGASRWQTAIRIVLPTASPGIFSAIMIGFGRAVGETMIVLMATGNTPILSLSPFNGMRTLSANIAVEIPEAPMDGTLYRVLFLSAMLLFLLTFAVNTVAEIVRQRLREKYQAV